MIKYTNVRNPRWHTADRKIIHCEVQFEHIDGWVPFGAHIDDTFPHGVEIYNRLMNGDFGSIQEFELDLSSWTTQFNTEFSNMIDQVAVAHGYSNAVDCISFLFSNEHSEDAKKFKEWRDIAWTYRKDIISKSESRTLDSWDVMSLVQGCPKISW